MSKTKNYVERCLSGDASLEDLDDAIQEWHEAETSLEIWDFLGMTKDEYARICEDRRMLRLVIRSRHLRVPMSMKPLDLAVAARSADVSEREVIQTWLQKTGRS
ncbi:MAG: hypothetical protein MUE97_02165 [Phycisphaerales bacterium]|jgi:hypothetical protein|nr:hypothetical protein [Phycisphaerales bacterium]